MEFISLTSLVVALIEIYSFIENKYKALALIKKTIFPFFSTHRNFCVGNTAINMHTRGGLVLERVTPYF